MGAAFSGRLQARRRPLLSATDTRRRKGGRGAWRPILISPPGNVIWFDEDPVGVLAADSTTLAFANSSGGTATVLVGTGFTYGPPPEPGSIGQPTGGLVTAIVRTNIDGTVVYET